MCQRAPPVTDWPSAPSKTRRWRDMVALKHRLDGRCCPEGEKRRAWRLRWGQDDLARYPPRLFRREGPGAVPEGDLLSDDRPEATGLYPPAQLLELPAIRRMPAALASWTASVPTPPLAALMMTVWPGIRLPWMKRACQAVRPARGTAPAWGSETDPGVRARFRASTATNWAAAASRYQS